MRDKLQLVLVLCAGVLLLCSSRVHAFGWDDLWKRSDQQFRELIDKGEFTQAESRVANTDDSALLKYRAGDFEASAELYGQSKQDYNRATALTRSGDYEAAIEAYEQVLADSVDYENAMHNRKIAQKLAELQQQNQQQGEGDEGEGSGEPQEGDQNPSDQPSGSDSDSGEQSDQSQDGDENSSTEPKEGDGGESADDKKSPQQEREPGQGNQGETDQDSKNAQPSQSKPHDERQQELDQWLQQVPDDPAGLLRARIMREHQRTYGNSRDKEQAW